MLHTVYVYIPIKTEKLINRKKINKLKEILRCFFYISNVATADILRANAIDMGLDIACVTSSKNSIERKRISKRIEISKNLNCDK